MIAVSEAFKPGYDFDKWGVVNKEDGYFLCELEGKQFGFVDLEVEEIILAFDLDCFAALSDKEMAIMCKAMVDIMEARRQAVGK